MGVTIQTYNKEERQAMKLSFVFLVYMVFHHAIAQSKEEINNIVQVVVDKALDGLGDHILDNDKDPVRLPDQEKRFKQKIVFFTVSGSARLFNGKFHGLSDVRKTRNSTVTADDQKIYVDSELSVPRPNAYYDARAEISGAGVSASARLRPSYLNARVKLEMCTTEPNCRARLTDFDLDIGSIDVDLDGFGVLKDFVDKLTTWITNNFRSQIKNQIEREVKK